MRPITIVGILCVAASGAGLASACSSGSPFGEAEPGSADAAIPEAAATDAPVGDASAVPDAPVSVDAATCVLATSPTLVAATVGAATKLGTNGASLFWIEGGTRIVRASLSDCSTTVVATGNISALAVDPNWIVWGDDTYKALGRNEVGAGIAPKTYPAPISPSLILAGGTALWNDVPDKNVSACVTPCIALTVATLIDSPTLLAANASRFFVFGLDADSSTTASALFWHELNGGSLHGPIATSADPRFLAANDLRVFWATLNGAVTGTPTGGGTSIAFGTVSDVRALAVDDAYVYVATATMIQRAPVSGGAWSPVVTGETAIKSLLVTPDAVVWGTSVAVRRILKPG